MVGEGKHLQKYYKVDKIKVFAFSKIHENMPRREVRMESKIMSNGAQMASRMPLGRQIDLETLPLSWWNASADMFNRIEEGGA